jgi:hypothetical protein
MENIPNVESLYNGAYTKINRLDTLKFALHMAFAESDFKAVRAFLLDLRSELNPKMTDQQKKDGDSYEDIMYGVEFSGNPNLKKAIDYERFLFDIEDKLGLDMPAKKDEWADDDEW